MVYTELSSANKIRLRKNHRAEAHLWRQVVSLNELFL